MHLPRTFMSTHGISLTAQLVAQGKLHWCAGLSARPCTFYTSIGGALQQVWQTAPECFPHQADPLLLPIIIAHLGTLMVGIKAR